MISTAASLICILISLLEMKGEQKNNICVLHLLSKNIMESEGEINKIKRLKNQIKCGENASNASISIEPIDRVDTPYKQPSEENEDYNKDS